MHAIEKMGFYSRFLFPKICDFLLDRPLFARYRRELLAQASGEVLEIGLGTGLNLPHYPRHVGRVTAVDPNPGMYRKAQRRIETCSFPVEQRVASSEALPFGDATFDCVVSTWTLCSVDDVERALREIYRVLRPGGQLLFLEHGLSNEPKIQKWQRRLNWLEMRLGDHCRLDRNMRALVSRQPFQLVEVEEFSMERIPATHGYMYRGAAVK